MGMDRMASKAHHDADKAKKSIAPDTGRMTHLGVKLNANKIEGHGERLRLQLLLNKQRYASLAPLGCTNFGCTIVFNGDLDIFQCI